MTEPDQLLSLEGRFLLCIQEYLRGPVQDAAAVFYTSLGNAGLIFIAAAVLMLLFKATRRAGLTASVALGFGAVCTNLILKNLVARPRPWLDVAGLVPLIAENDPNSFPSGHATAAFAFGFALLFAAPKRWMKWAAMVGAVLMAFSRLYVGVHYPTDVLGGVLVGLLSAWLAHMICKKKTK